MAVFSPTILVNTTPPLVVTIADPGSPGVTYQQFQNSLGQYVYLVQGFYVFCTNLNQLTGAVNYNRYDAGGNQDITNIVTTVDPYQDATSIVVDLKRFKTDVVLNGNSSIRFEVLPNVEIQFKTFNRRIENSFGRHLNNFKDIEFLDFKPDFFYNYGDRTTIAEANKFAQETASLGRTPLEVYTPLTIGGYSADSTKKPFPKDEKIIDQERDKIPVMFLAIAAISVGALILNRK